MTSNGTRRTCSCGEAWADEPGHDDTTQSSGNTDAYVVRIYGPVGDKLNALLEERQFMDETEARELYAGYPLGDGVTLVEFAATWDGSGSERRSAYVADPDNPTDGEIAAAIQRSLELGTLIDADEWMARHAGLAS